MPSASISAAQDKDSLHILPLSMIPLETSGLQQARLIKNSRLEGVVELYSGAETGSAQISPEELDRVFQFNEKNRKDREVIEALGPLSSYDVYSLRIELRRLGIAVDDHSSLQLSEDKRQELSGYMREFTKPLISAVYGGTENGAADMADVMRLFTSPDKDAALQNLMKMSKALNVEITDIPAFLQTYGDVYLSLAYYQYCLDQNWKHLSSLLKSLEEIRRSPQFKASATLLKTCGLIEKKLKATVFDIKNILEVFSARTADMWGNISSERFSDVKEMITAYQTSIGGALCTITVKLNAWKERFPTSDSGSINRRADFIMSDIRPGIEGLQGIKLSD